MNTSAPIHTIHLPQRFAYSTLLLIPLFLYSCKKNNDTAPQNNDEVKATIVPSSGNTITINATGAKAKIGKDIYGIAFYIVGTNDANAGVNVSFPSITVPGTYSHLCEYRVNAASQTTPIYINASSFVTNRGNVTITALTDHHIEGTFSATCKTHSGATDSVAVTGSFKGDY
jgi:hypothetical protein